MMGQQGGSQDRLFYSFNLDDQVHAITCCEASTATSTSVSAHPSRAFLQPHRPPIDHTELMMRMLIVGYCFGIRSERGFAKRSS